MSEYESSIPARFESIAKRFPDRLAVVDDQHSATYAELNAAANRIAHGLLERLGSGSEPVVHIFEHSVEAVTAVLGILKAGKFYVPLSRLSPPEHLRQIIKNVETRLILTDLSNNSLAMSAADGQSDISTLTDIAGSAWQNPNVALGPDDYLYVVFTSGSTGAPKGVIQNHRNALHLAGEYANTSPDCVEERHLFPNHLSYSASKTTLYGALLDGSTLFLYDIHRQGIENLPRWISQHRLTLLPMIPPIFRLLAENLRESTDLSSVRLLWMGGDRILPTDLEAFWRLSPDSSLIRTGYSASEARVIAHMQYDRQSTINLQELAVGWPGSGVDILIADEDGNELAPGAVGEIVVHSRFVSPGYWQQPELTQRTFRPDPEQSGVFYYNTGDLGRIGDDGRVYHLGRIDSQVKIRGQRVELGEIEQALLDLEGVKETIVAVRDRTNPEQQLLAWLVWKEPAQSLSASELRHRLGERLPSYMIPTNFFYLERFPINANGKIDRHALPEPDTSTTPLDRRFVAPRTRTEEILTGIWTMLLDVKQLGIHDNFFELGGHSLKATQLVAHIRDSFQVTLPLDTFFKHPTIAESAQQIEAIQWLTQPDSLTVKTDFEEGEL